MTFSSKESSLDHPSPLPSLRGTLKSITRGVVVGRGMLEASARGVLGVCSEDLPFEFVFVRFVGDLVFFEGDFGIVLVQFWW